MKVFYSDTFNIPLPAGHRFPGEKYSKLRHHLMVEGLLGEDNLEISPLAQLDQILTAHARDYVNRFETGAMDDQEIRRIGFPWSDFLVKRTRATTGGAIAAARCALKDGISGQLAGGTHHAHRDFGAGYCIYNDQAVAAMSLLQDGEVNRVLIIDLDVHQGDGTADIMQHEPRVFVFSMHGEKNFPFRKVPSDLDIGLPDGTSDRDYLYILEQNLDRLFDFKPDLVLYQAGVDPLKEDRLGRLDLTYDGLMARDRMVLSACQSRNIPVSMAIGGGYSEPIDATVAAYVNTYRVVQDLFT